MDAGRYLLETLSPEDKRIGCQAEARIGMMLENHKKICALRVFLCHSSGDKSTVRKLYQDLKAEKGIQPWLDEEALLAGQDWGLYDMFGNVWEWCGDDGTVCGGAWDALPGNLRAANRFRSLPDHRAGHIGFRVVCLPRQ